MTERDGYPRKLPVRQRTEPENLVTPQFCLALAPHLRRASGQSDPVFRYLPFGSGTGFAFKEHKDRRNHDYQSKTTD